MGPNGSGKTTTLRLITGLLRPDGGQVMVDGIDPSRDPIARRAAASAHSPMAWATTRASPRANTSGTSENCAECRPPNWKLRTRFLLDLFDMHDIADRRAQGFSQGERMKLALARAMINDPPNILLDEPANGLDVPSARALRSLLERFRDAGKCVLLCSHLMAEVSPSAIRWSWLLAARWWRRGSPAELMRCAATRAVWKKPSWS